MKCLITLEDVRKNRDIRAYMERGNENLNAKGFTEHSFIHAELVARNAAYILETLGYSEREQELARIAGFMHDIGNTINRDDHAQSGALMAFRLLSDMGMDAEEVAIIMSAIGNHDEGSGTPVNPVSAALILADKCDVRRSRVRNNDVANFDIHDRVNYSATKSEISVDNANGEITLKLTIDPELSSIMDYFEIFMERMMMNRRAALLLNMKFCLVINDTKLM
ncbi:MAG: HD domain-containing protein [Clostridia bacterium]|nr:HD domain-containing protein [Clostridia bacterium]